MPVESRGSTAPLSGYRFLDLTDEKGMFCSRLLADMGAEVIRVEKPGKGSVKSLFSWAANLGKKSITLNIESSDGRGIFERLVGTVDGIVESYPPGYLASLGIGYAELSQINPRLIIASITGFGQTGPDRDYRSSDIVASAQGGWMSVCGEVDMPPLKPYGEQAYYTAGLFGAIGILLALRHRQATGKGQYLDISLQECVAATLDHVLVRFLYEGVVARRQASLYWNSAFSIFPCRDGYILLSLFHQWETLVEWLEAEGMAEDLTDKKWQDRAYRLEHLDHAIEVLEHWTQSHTAGELVETGQAMRFPWAEVTAIPKLMNSLQLRERGFWVEVEPQGGGKKLKFPGPPARLSESPWRVGSRLPDSGQDNAAIYQALLGLSRKELEALASRGVI